MWAKRTLIYGALFAYGSLYAFGNNEAALACLFLFNSALSILPYWMSRGYPS